MKEEEVLNQIESAYSSVYNISESKLKKYNNTPSNIIFSSVGKSGIVERIINNIGVNVPIEVASEDNFPDINNRSLVIIVSYSGKTKEILNFYEKAQEKTKKIIVITRRKRLLDNVKEKNFLGISLNQEYRSANSHFLTLYATIFLLNRLNLLKTNEKEIQESILEIGNFSKNFKTFKYADVLLDKIPLIYTWNEFSCLGFMISNYFNVHAKHFAIRSCIPEADYNEIEALGYGDNKIIPIFLLPKGKEFEKARLFMNTYRLMSSKKMNCLSYEMNGDSKLTQIVTTAMFFELVSERLGKLKKIDPSSREYIEQLREKIKKF